MKNKTHYFRRCTLGGYGYTIIRVDSTFVSKPFKTPLDTLISFRKSIKL